jgi:hypothetical protein
MSAPLKLIGEQSKPSPVNRRLLVVGFFALFLSVLPSWAEITTTNYQFTLQTARANGLYQQGEVVRFGVTLLQNGEHLPNAEIWWSTSKDGLKSFSTLVFTATSISTRGGLGRLKPSRAISSSRQCRVCCLAL